jgi:hypothetical protein
MSRLNGYLDSFTDQAGYRQHGGIWSGVSRGDTIIQSSGTISVSGYRNFDVQILGGSGAFKYVGGAFEGWHVKMANLNPSAGSGRNGLFPLAVSGIFSLQDAYVGNPDLIIQSEANAGGAGTMTFTTNDRKWKLVQGQRAPINISGALKVPIVGGVSFNETGDIAMCHHAQVMQPNSFNFPVDDAEADARSLGPGTLTLNTGSGIINMSVGSGIAFITAKQDVRMPFLLDNWARLPMSGLAVEDKMFSQNTAGSGINFMVAGMYLVNYHLSFQKVLGTTARTIAVRAILKNKGSETEGGGSQALSNFAGIPGSLSWTPVTNVTTLPFNTASATFLVNANVGQFLGFEAAQAGVGAVAAQAVNSVASGSYAIVQYIGPRRTFPVLD